MLPKSIFEFLVQLSLYNNKEWFNENKEWFLKAKSDFESYVSQLIDRVYNIDSSIGRPEAKDCIFRIYRDVRFAKDKLPYKNNFGAYMSLGGKKSIYAGYYIHIEPDNSFVGGGMYCPQPNELKLVREKILEQADSYKAIIEAPEFKIHFPTIIGDTLKTAPKGFDKNDPNIYLVRNKSYAVMMPLSDETVLSNDLNLIVENAFFTLVPFNNFLNDAIKYK